MVNRVLTWAKLSPFLLPVLVACELLLENWWLSLFDAFITPLHDAFDALDLSMLWTNVLSDENNNGPHLSETLDCEPRFNVVHRSTPPLDLAWKSFPDLLLALQSTFDPDLNLVLKCPPENGLLLESERNLLSFSTESGRKHWSFAPNKLLLESWNLAHPGGDESSPTCIDQATMATLASLMNTSNYNKLSNIVCK